jgi:hypothetical protein
VQNNSTVLKNPTTDEKSNDVEKLTKMQCNSKSKAPVAQNTTSAGGRQKMLAKQLINKAATVRDESIQRQKRKN